MLEDIKKVVEFFDSSEQGKIIISLEAWVNDFIFRENPPVVQAYLLPEKTKFSEDDLSVLRSNIEYLGTYISTHTPLDQRTLSCHIPFKEESSSLFGGKKLPRNKLVWVLVVPVGEWGERYNLSWMPVNAIRGKTVFLPISLEPTKTIEPDGEED